MTIRFNDYLYDIETLEEIENLAPINDCEENGRYSSYVDVDAVVGEQIKTILSDGGCRL